ncbi:23765_t:CDS:1, partial [Racocetra persica]
SGEMISPFYQSPIGIDVTSVIGELVKLVKLVKLLKLVSWLIGEMVNW